MAKKITSISIREDLKDKANKALEDGVFPGISSLSGLIEYALEKILSQEVVAR